MRRIAMSLCVAAIFLTFAFIAVPAKLPRQAAAAASKTRVTAKYGNADSISEEELKIYDYFLAADQLEGRAKMIDEREEASDRSITIAVSAFRFLDGVTLSPGRLIPYWNDAEHGKVSGHVLELVKWRVLVDRDMRPRTRGSL